MELRSSVTRRRAVVAAGVVALLAVGAWGYVTFVGGTYCAYEEEPAFHPTWSQTGGEDGVTVRLEAVAGEELPADRLIVIANGERASWAARAANVAANDTVGPGSTLRLDGLTAGDEVAVELWDRRPPTPRNRCSSTANFTYDTYVVE